MSHPYTVIAFAEETGIIITHHVSANNGMSAFAQAAAMDPELTMVVAIEGWNKEGVELTFPGEALVDSETILDQPDVFPVVR